MKQISVIGNEIPTKGVELNYLSLYNNSSLSETDILIFSPSEFYNVYLSENEDREFAKKCREAIFRHLGERVIFPNIME